MSAMQSAARGAVVAGWLLGASLASGTAVGAVGTSAGATGVSPNGAPTYSLPIRPTEGIGAMTPRLSIEYVGPGRRTILGIGFDLAGLSYITPCRRTIAQDLNAAPVTLTAEDRYCLDGARLRLTGGSPYGASDTVYRMEIDAIAQVTARESIGNIPGWFEVKTRDGLTYEYGRTANAKLLAHTGANAPPQFWAVNKISDRAGNSIHFQYENDTATRKFRPSFIRYSDRGAVQGHYRIDFIYESADRPDPVFSVTPSSTGGAAHEELRRLQELRLLHDGAAYRKFVFDYSAGAGDNSRLTSVQECATIGADACYPPTSFGWQDGTEGYHPLAETSGTVAAGILPLDLNGDGFEDIVWAKSGTWRYRLGGAGGYGAEQNTGIAATNPTKAMRLSWNDDSFDDLLVDWSDGKWRVLRGQASGGFLSPLHAGPNGTSIPSNQANTSWVIVDANSDGRDDLLRMTLNAFLTIQLRINAGLGFGSEVVAYSSSSMKTLGAGFIRDSGASIVRRPDFNGDGRTDLLVYACEWEPAPAPGFCWWTGWFQLLSNGSSYTLASDLPYATYSSEIRYGDFNADGLTDLVYPAQTPGRWYLGFGQGGAGVAISAGPLLADYATYQTVTGDYDGDGYDDFFATRSSDWTWHVFRGTGTTLAATPIATGIDANGQGWMQTDANGDSLVDLARFNIGTLKWGLYARAGVPGERLTSVEDGLANVTTFAYLPMSNTTVYTRGAAATFPAKDFTASLPLVHRRGVAPAGAAAYEVTYQYGSGQIHAQGRNFLGMGSREIADDRPDSLATTETYRQDFPFIGSLASVTVKQPASMGGDIVHTTHHSYSQHVLEPTAGNERYLPYRGLTVTNDYEVGGTRDGDQITQVSEAHTVNTWGNSTFIAIEVRDKDALSPEFNLVYRTEITATHRENVPNWCIGPLLTRSEKRILADGSNATRSASWSVVNAQCRVTQETLEPSGDASETLVTDFGYDSCGNVDLVTAYAAAAPSLTRTTQLDHGSRCQRPESITNAENHVTGIAYDWPRALPASLTDPNGLVTQFSHDGFGRLTREQRPDGTGAQVELAACDAGGGWCGKGDAGARLRLTRTERNTSDAVLRTDERILDGLGRVRWTHGDSLESGPAIVETLYDPFNRPIARTRPYFAGNPVFSTVVEYDLIGRVTKIDEPVDESAVSGRITEFAYEGRNLRVTDPKNLVTTRTSNVLGQLRHLEDPGALAMASYAYHPFGEPKSVTDAAGNVTGWEVNARGLVIETSDPDAGTWTYEVNAFGETAKIRDAKTSAPAWTTVFTFDDLSRPLTRVEAEGTTNFTYGVPADNTATNKYVGHLKSVSSPGGYAESYLFDSLARLDRLRTTIAGTSYDFNIDYVGTTGLLNTIRYPVSTGGTRFRIQYQYSSNLVRRVKEYQGTTTYWQGNSTDAWGHYQDELFGNGVVTITDLDQANGLMLAREAGLGGGTGLINALLAPGDLNDNFQQRQDLKLSPAVTEAFNYDALNRIDYSTRNGSQNFDVLLAANGNIDTKDGLTYVYTGAQSGCSYYAHSQPRAVRKVGTTVYCYDANGNMTKRGGSNITYASYNLPTVINSGSNSSTLSYGAFRNRFQQVAVSGGTTETTIYVAGLFEKVTRPSGVVEYRHTIPGGNGAAALHTRRSSGVNDTYYLHRDHLGSPEVISNAAGAALIRLSFGAYGERRDGSDWQGPPSAGDLTTIGNLTRRGFTGHEHLDAVGLIHMNGRVYDPAIGRFLSPDPIIALGNSQAANSYSYVWNTPLNLTDPSGWCPSTEEGDDFTVSHWLPCVAYSTPRYSGVGRPASEKSGGSATGQPHYPHLRWNTNGWSSGGTDIVFGTPASTVGGAHGGYVDAIQAALDVASLGLDASVAGAPFSFIPDILNAGISLGQGDFTGAGLSTAAAIPFFGAAGNVTRLGRQAARAFGSLDDLSRAAAVASGKNGLTVAGHALTKHATGQRAGSSVFPMLGGNPAAINRQAQDIVDDILTAPGTTILRGHRGRFGDTIEYVAPNGRGVVFGSDGIFLFFREGGL